MTRGEVPISRLLTRAEQRYTAVESQMRAVVYTLTKYLHYLWVTLFTASYNSVWRTWQGLPCRMARLAAEKLPGCNCTVKHKPGNDTQA